MMPCNYVAADGSKKDFDLDAVYEVIRAYSRKRAGWTSLVIYEPSHDVFIELRDSPQDVRGNSQDEAEEISPAEIAAHYGIAETVCLQIRKNPRTWRLIDQRQGV